VEHVSLLRRKRVGVAMTSACCWRSEDEKDVTRRRGRERSGQLRRSRRRKRNDDSCSNG
jgi:hypothetical protein